MFSRLLKTNLLILAACVFVANAGFGAPLATEGASAPAPCAVLENFAGDIQIMDSSRTHLIVAEKKTGIPCGGWVSLGKGWARVRHRDGQQIHLGSETFAEFPENNSDGKYSGDHLVLYKGQAFGQAGSGTGELKMITANARVRTSRGTVVLVFSHSEEESQLICLENSAYFENRFQAASRVRVSAGEASSLNFKLLRVVPSAARAVAVASLRPKLADLHVEEREQSYAIRTASERAERSLPAPVREESNGNAKPSKGKRGLASLNSNYNRHQADKQNAELNAYWAKKIAGGAEVGERILFPEKLYGRPQTVKVNVEEPQGKRGVQYQKSEEAEKKRLIEELSQIHID